MKSLPAFLLVALAASCGGKSAPDPTLPKAGAVEVSIAAVTLADDCGTGPIVGGECRAGLSPCGHSCVNLGADPNNCGSCGYQCADNEQCLVGVCIDAGPAVIGQPGA